MRRGELIAGSGGILLIVALFSMSWFDLRGPAARLASRTGEPASLDGWQALTTTRWFLLVTIVVALALVILSASQRAPAVPVTSSMATCVLGVISAVLLLYRIFDHHGLAARAGIYVGLVAALAVAYGGFRSLRTEGSPFGDPDSIEIVPIGRTESTSAGRPGP